MIAICQCQLTERHCLEQQLSKGYKLHTGNDKISQTKLIPASGSACYISPHV